MYFKKKMKFILLCLTMTLLISGCNKENSPNKKKESTSNNLTSQIQSESVDVTKSSSNNASESDIPRLDAGRSTKKAYTILPEIEKASLNSGLIQIGDDVFKQGGYYTVNQFLEQYGSKYRIISKINLNGYANPGSGKLLEVSSTEDFYSFYIMIVNPDLKKDCKYGDCVVMMFYPLKEFRAVSINPDSYDPAKYLNILDDPRRYIKIKSDRKWRIKAYTTGECQYFDGYYGSLPFFSDYASTLFELTYVPFVGRHSNVILCENQTSTTGFKYIGTWKNAEVPIDYVWYPQDILKTLQQMNWDNAPKTISSLGSELVFSHELNSYDLFIKLDTIYPHSGFSYGNDENGNTYYLIFTPLEEKNLFGVTPIYTIFIETNKADNNVSRIDMYHNMIWNWDY